MTNAWFATILGFRGGEYQVVLAGGRSEAEALGAAHIALEEGMVPAEWVSACTDDVFASAIEAPSGGETTKIGSTEGESAVAESETPKTSSGESGHDPLD